MTLDAKQAARCDQLFKMGLMFNGSSYVGKDLLEDVNVPALDIQCVDDMQWERDMGRLQREINRRNALPPLNVEVVSNRGGLSDYVYTHYNVNKENVFVEPVLGEFWRSRLFTAIENKKGAGSFLIAVYARSVDMVKRMLQLNSDVPEIGGVRFVIVGLTEEFSNGCD